MREATAIEPTVPDEPGILETRIESMMTTDNYESNRRMKASGGNALIQKKDYEALAAFRYALNKFFRFSEQAASKHGLSMMQYEALLRVRGFPGKEDISIGEMAEWLQIKYRSVVDLVDRLESEGLVSSKKCKEDKFSILIRITNKGRRVLEKLASLNKKELQRLQSQIRQLSDLL